MIYQTGVSAARLIHVIITPVWRSVRAKITIPEISWTQKNIPKFDIHVWVVLTFHKLTPKSTSKTLHAKNEAEVF